MGHMASERYITGDDQQLPVEAGRQQRGEPQPYLTWRDLMDNFGGLESFFRAGGAFEARGVSPLREQYRERPEVNGTDINGMKPAIYGFELQITTRDIRLAAAAAHETGNQAEPVYKDQFRQWPIAMDEIATRIVVEVLIGQLIGSGALTREQIIEMVQNEQKTPARYPGQLNQVKTGIK